MNERYRVFVSKKWKMIAFVSNAHVVQVVYGEEGTISVHKCYSDFVAKAYARDPNYRELKR